jgi:hypothetical protein
MERAHQAALDKRSEAINGSGVGDTDDVLDVLTEAVVDGFIQIVGREPVIANPLTDAEQAALVDTAS